ncbi:MAG: electron transfer flavoprotein subunit alpha/FixB family protein [Gammaproteobacteria bacterium]|nr:electron transfer flavoprotein subunit alpha/FixB family protein [Gammaproteobacteria bacterium]
MSVLVLAEHDNQQLHPATAHVLSAAGALGNEVIVLVAGHDCRAVADEVSMLSGVSQVRLVDAACYAYPLAENLSTLIASMLEGVDALLAPATTFGKDVLPRVAAMCDTAQLSDVTKIIDNETFEHPIYAGNAIETVRVLDALKVLSIRTTAFDAVIDAQAACPIEVLDAVFEAANTQFIDAVKPESTRPELTAAKRVVSGGRGLQSAEQFKLIEDLADSLGAAVGASRAAVDAGFISNDHQVGQTGKIVAPSLYIAVGISGAVQHLAGIKDAKVIVAINKDEEAPIFQIADYALVGDLFTLVPELMDKLKG